MKQVDEETVTKGNNILLIREHTASLLSGDVEYSDEMKSALMIEGDVKKQGIHWSNKI